MGPRAGPSSFRHLSSHDNAGDGHVVAGPWGFRSSFRVLHSVNLPRGTRWPFWCILGTWAPCLCACRENWERGKFNYHQRNMILAFEIAHFFIDLMPLCLSEQHVCHMVSFMQFCKIEVSIVILRILFWPYFFAYQP